MTQHSAIAPGHGAIITGAASGIGRAAALFFAESGMGVALVDQPGQELDNVVSEVAQAARDAGHVDTAIFGHPCDVSRLEEVEELADPVSAVFDHIGILMNNAGVNAGGGAFETIDRWRTLMDVNLWGVIHGCQVFAPRLLAQNGPSAIINTGSKQGITNPPGNAAYNVSKAAVKAYTEALAHELRNTEGRNVSAHLLVPGFTYTGMSKARHPSKPDEAWTPAQVIAQLNDGMAAGDFYIICPDNAVDEETDRRRIAWGAADMTENRPALSRWHPDHADAFAEYLDRDRT